MGYDELETSLREVPMTWVPALMATLISRGIDLGVWREGKVGEFAVSCERRHTEPRMKPTRG